MKLRTPVVFFIFNRPAFTEKVFALIAQAKPEQLFVIADGPRSPAEWETCSATRRIVEKVDWECQVRTNFSETNLGNGRRGSSGLDWVFSHVEEAIILEDDTVPHPSLFQYCQELLKRYRKDLRVMQINSTNFQNGRNKTPYSYYFSRIPHCWAWATWRRAWRHFDFKMRSWPDNQEMLLQTFDDEIERQFMFEIFDRAYTGKSDTWDFRWIYAFLTQSGLAITPHANLVSKNRGSSDSTYATPYDHPTARVPTSDIGALRNPPHMVVHRAADRHTFNHALELAKERDTAKLEQRTDTAPAGGATAAVCGSQDRITEMSDITTVIDRALSPVFKRLDDAQARAAASECRLEQLQSAFGRIEARQLGTAEPGAGPLASREFRVFSQWGEDGIIQWLVGAVDVGPKIFVEFGVENYREANTRFLAEHNNWTGLVIDGSRESIEEVRRSSVSWRQNLRAVAAFVTRDNINQLISNQGISGRIGLLSIDIDGNDYWVWEAVTIVDPAIVVVEYNHRFGSELAVTIPYETEFRRGERHPVYYFGASLRALCLLGARKGYAFVGCNSNGVNAFFVRRDALPTGFRELTPTEGFVAGMFTESRDGQGQFIPSDAERERLEILRLPLVTVTGPEEAEEPSHTGNLSGAPGGKSVLLGPTPQRAYELH